MLGGAVLFLGLLHNFLFYREGFGLNILLFVIALLASGWILARRFNAAEGEGSQKLTRDTIVLTSLILFFSIMSFIRASSLLTFFNILGIILLLFLLVQSHTGKRIRDLFPEDYAKIFRLPFMFAPYFEKTFSDFRAARNAEKGIEGKSTISKEVIRGIVVAIAALIVFTMLLVSADEIFASVVRRIFSFDIDPDLFGRAIIFAIVTAFLIAAFGYLLKKQDDEKNSGKAVSAESGIAPSFALSGGLSGSNDASKGDSHKVGHIETTIVLASVCALFLVFICLQLAYLFGGQSHILAQGMTYAEYARKGFFELIVVAIFAYMMISFAEKRIVKKGEGHLSSFKAVSSILIAEVVAILVSAFYRLALYEQAYGFSTIRLYSHALMIWLGVVLVLLALHIVSAQSDVKGRKRFGLRIFFSVSLLLACMNLLNPDAFIAEKNIDRYAETGKIDAAYLASLSDDAVPVTVHLLKDADKSVRAEFADALAAKRDGMTESWKSSHISSMRAKVLLAK